MCFHTMEHYFESNLVKYVLLFLLIFISAVHHETYFTCLFLKSEALHNIQIHFIKECFKVKNNIQLCQVWDVEPNVNKTRLL